MEVWAGSLQALLAVPAVQDGVSCRLNAPASVPWTCRYLEAYQEDWERRAVHMGNAVLYQVSSRAGSLLPCGWWVGWEWTGNTAALSGPPGLP